jgi:LmbE family N-acetylglucosaminyl deacetylase
MSSEATGRRKHRTLPGRGHSYEVGYGKPPAATRFKAGQSGNPLGGSKGSRTSARPSLNEERLKSIILDEAYRAISVNDANGPITIPMAQAVIRSLAVNAQRLFTQLLAAIERDNKQLHDEWLDAAINYKAEWARELERRKKHGIQAPDPVPHPDHVVIDFATGSVRIIGPMTKDEKVIWDAWRKSNGQESPELAELLKRDPAKAVDVGIFQSVPVPAEPNITRIERIIVNPRERPTDTNSFTDE